MTYTADKFRDYAKSSEAVKRYRNSEKARDCRKRYNATEKGRAVERSRHVKRRDETRALIDKSKRRPCFDCGASFDPICMDFHHVRGTKSFNIGLGRYAPSTVAKEIEKCIVLCACCHRLRHKRQP